MNVCQHTEVIIFFCVFTWDRVCLCFYVSDYVSYVGVFVSVCVC